MRVSAALITLLAATNVVFAIPGRDIVARGSKTLPLHSDSELSRRASEIVTARQFQYLQNRAPLLDVCASLSVDTIIGNSEILGIPLKEILGLDLCLCLSALPLKLGLSAQLDALINKYGGPLINAVVEILIDTSFNKKHCSKPEFSSCSCTLQDPCGFSCDPPYTKVGNQCVCEPPYMVCNGHCVLPPGGVCSSAAAHTIARRTTLHQNAQADCASNEEVCGVYGGTEYAYECVNVKTNLESCGGCVIPNPFHSHTSPAGIDCSAIEHADSVSCVSGRCVVQTCESGWEVDEARVGCTRPQNSDSATSANVLSVLADLLNVKRDEDERHHEDAKVANKDFITGAFW